VRHIVKTGHAEIRFFQRIDDAVQTMPTAAGLGGACRIDKVNPGTKYTACREGALRERPGARRTGTP
jgi:hypothetical protein